MLNQEKFYYKTGGINEKGIVPDVDILPSLKITYFDCDENLKQYAETLLCDGDDAICVMTVEDSLGNSVGFDLRVRGDVRVGGGDDLNDDFTYYKHYSQFPTELHKAISNGDYYSNEHVDVSENNWLETVYYITKADETEEESTDSIVFEYDISEMTPDEVKEILMNYAREIFSVNYEINKFKKPDITLDDMFKYANLRYSETEKGDEIAFPNFPEKGINTYFQRDFLEENSYDIYLNDAKSNAILVSKSDCDYHCLYENIIEVACGTLECDNGKTIKENLKSEKTFERE